VVLTGICFTCSVATMVVVGHGNGLFFALSPETCRAIVNGNLLADDLTFHHGLRKQFHLQCGGR